jgi:hypothetical protein
MRRRCLRRSKERLAAGQQDELLPNAQHSLVEIEILVRQTEALTLAKASASGQNDEGPIPLGNGVDERSHHRRAQRDDLDRQLLR